MKGSAPDAGTLRHVLAYQTKADVPDDFGQEKPSWTTLATYRASNRSPTGREVISAQNQKKAVVTHVLTFRYPGFLFDPACRLIEGTDVYNIISATDPDGRRRKMEVMVSFDPAEQA